MGLSFPLGYAVVLTERGKNYLEGITDGAFDSSYAVPQGEKEYQNIMKRIQKKVGTAFEQQKAIERMIGDEQIRQAFNAYSMTSPITLKKKKGDEILKVLSESDKERKERYKEFNKLMDNRKTIVHRIMSKIAEWEHLGKTKSSPEALIVAFKQLNLDLAGLEKELDKIESNLENFAQEEVVTSKDFQENFQKLLATYRDSKDFDIGLTADEFTGAMKIKVTSKKSGSSKAAEALQAYFQKLIDEKSKHAKDMQELAKKIRNAKSTSYSGRGAEKGGIRYLLNMARAAIADTTYEINMTDDKKDAHDAAIKSTRANAQMAALTDEIADAIVNGKQSFSFVAPTVELTESVWGDISETEHSLHFKENISEETRDSVIKMIYSGQRAWRTQFQLDYAKSQSQNLSNRKKTMEKLDTSYADDPFFDEQKESYESYAKKESQTTAKVDNLLSITNEKGEYYIAFSDKFYSGFNLSRIALIGKYDLSSKEMETASLLNNIDLFMSSGNEQLTSQLIFILLNMASASVYSADFAAQKEKITYIVQQMVSSYLIEMAFNIESFIDNLLKDESFQGSSISQNNTFLVFNLTDGLFVKSTDLLQGLLEQFKRLGDEGFQELVTVTIAEDTAHRAVPLYQAALKQVPPTPSELRGNITESKQERWEWVATQIAKETQLSVKLTIHSLLQFFDYQ